MSETRTEENLALAFAAEAKACLRLLGYAEKADDEDLPAMAKLFRAISLAERVHAVKHLHLLKIIEDTQTNLEKSFERETSVSGNAYPEMIRIASEEGDKRAAMSFSQARDAEESHAQLYKAALEAMMEDKEHSYFVCSICGYVAEDEAPEVCPVCNAKRDKFLKSE